MKMLALPVASGAAVGVSLVAAHAAAAAAWAVPAAWTVAALAAVSGSGQVLAWQAAPVTLSWSAGLAA